MKRSSLKRRYRKRANGDPAYREWIAGFACVVCGAPSVCCHVRGKRMWGDIGNCWPGCTTHHDEQHAHGIQTFSLKYSLDLPGTAAGFGEVWLEYHGKGPG